jgi:outer membrane protein assembly factor BamB
MYHMFSRWQRVALRWLWALVGGLGLTMLLGACFGQPCGTVAAVATPPALLAAANGIFYLGEAEGVQINALRASDGTHLWTGPIARFEGAADGYVFFLKGTTLEARRDQDQALLWQYSPAGLPALAVDQGVVYIAAANAVSALRESDGSPLWQQSLAFTPLRLKATAGTVYALGPQSLTALRERDGSTLWQTDATANIASKLVVDADTIYVNSDQRVLALRASDGTQRWQVDTSSAGIFLAAGGGMAYLATEKSLNALRASDGSIAWQVPTPTQGLPVASVLPLGASVVYTGLNQHIYAVRASDGSLLWQKALQIPYSGTNALAATNGIIAVGTVDSVQGSSCGSEVFYPVAASVRASDGSVLWYSKTNHP